MGQVQIIAKLILFKLLDRTGFSKDIQEIF